MDPQIHIFFSNIRFLSFIVTLSFSKAHPPKVMKNANFQKWYFLLFSFVTLSLLAKNYVSITKIVTFGPLGPFWPFWKGPRTYQKRKCSKITISSVLLCHTEPTYQKICFYNKNCEFWPLGPLLPFLKGPPNSSKTEIFKNYNVFCLNLSHWAYLPKIMFLSPKLRLLAL